MLIKYVQKLLRMFDEFLQGEKLMHYCRTLRFNIFEPFHPSFQIFGIIQLDEIKYSRFLSIKKIKLSPTLFLIILYSVC